MSDLIGQRFGKLVVIAHSHDIPRKPRGVIPYWLCRCDCGNQKAICQWALTRGLTKSCACLSRQLASERSRKDVRLSDDPAYGCWLAMKDRCYREKHEHYARYGGRGILVCERWRNSFENFLKDMGPRPSLKHSLDRHPNANGNYEPGNVRWAIAKEQQRNMRSNHPIEFRGETKLLVEWAEIVGIKSNTIRMRLVKGWSVEKALTTGV